MGLFNFLSDVASATIKTVASPIAVVKDVVDIAIGDEPVATKKLIKSVGNDLTDAFDEMMP